MTASITATAQVCKRQAASYTSFMRHKRSILIILAALILSSCDLISGTQANPAATATSAGAAPDAAPESTPVLQSTPDIAIPITTTETTPSLTIWIPPDTLLGTETGTAVFSDQLLAFNANHPDLETRVEQKPVAGQGGILSYLRTGANVAPDILPDLIALPTSQLAAAAEEGLIYPLDDLLDPAALDDLYPAARALARPEEQTIGYPFAVTNLTHLVYQTNVITGTPPLRWNELAAGEDASFIFPAAGDEGAMLTLQFYLAAGGALTNEAGQPALDAPLLTQALQQLSQGRSVGFILLQSSNADSFAESWEVFQAGAAAYALTAAEQFLTKRTPETEPGYAVIPGLDGPLTPLVDGWAWAIAANDPVQRALAGELLSFLIDGPNLSEWSLQSARLPARRQAFAAWPHDDAYTSFIHLELERAQPNPIAPSGQIGGQIMEALGNAAFDVISLAKSPQEAAGEAVTAVQP
ncbi:MAG: extracellular solute-binding protein [Chloroflexi bacterium]|nr:extracellular solute-binding protein [Chloroflexota bacterium]